MVGTNLANEIGDMPLDFSGFSDREKIIWHGNVRDIAFDEKEIKSRLLNLNAGCYVIHSHGRLGITNENCKYPNSLNGAGTSEMIIEIPPMPSQNLGDPSFQSFHGVDYSYAAGAMAGGIASEELVISLGKEKILSSFGTGGLAPERVERAIHLIQKELPNGPYAFNLLHSPNEPALERYIVDLFLKNGIGTVEASAFLDLTPSIVYYRAAGLSLTNDNQIEIGNKIVAKLSRQEVASKFLKPAPRKILETLVNQGAITDLQASLAERVPMADDITVEADSGGHTDNRALVCLLPSIIELRDRIQKQYRFDTPVRVGAAGGIGTPHSALAAFTMGAAYVVTGSINQSCLEAGTSVHTKKLLSQAEMPDVMMAPAGDMFELGVKLQVLKRGTLFPLRAQKLLELYNSYDSIDAIPTKDREKLEKQIFRQSLESVWESTTQYLAQRNPSKLSRALQNPKLKMALIFRWYLGLSSRWSSSGEVGREIDYQIWCGPAMGAFNNWVRGTYLENPANRRVVDIAHHLMTGAGYLYRMQTLKMQGLIFPDSYFKYLPVWLNA